MFRVLAGVALALGAVAFLAIPAYSKHTPARQGLATCPVGASPLICGNPGGLYTTQDYSTYANISCDTFEMKDACGPRFWMRTGAFGVGLVMAIVLLALAGPATRKDMPRLVGGHEVRWSPVSGAVCVTEGCGFQSMSREMGRAHRIETGATAEDGPSGPLATSLASSGSSPSTAASIGASSLVTSRSPTAPASASPEFKTCPDCAEEIRAAARKCRFCGYMFESADVTG
jgi:Uncharacterised protein family UPF0547